MTQTAGCEQPPAECPEASGPAKPFLTGTDEPGGSVNGGIDKVDLPSSVNRDCEQSVGIAAGLVGPFGYAARRAFLGAAVSAFAVPRKQLLDPKLKRIEDSVTLEEPFSGTYDEGPDVQGTVSGTYTDHLDITLKRLKLKR